MMALRLLAQHVVPIAPSGPITEALDRPDEQGIRARLRKLN